MTAFATADDFAVRYGVTLTPAEQTRADALLALASGVIEGEAETGLVRVTDDVYTRSGTSDERILLPGRPVESVSSVTLDGAAIDDWYLAGNVLVRRGGTVFLASSLADADPTYRRGFGCESQTLAITYTHGYAENAIPEWLKTLALEMVVRVWANPASVIQQNIGNTGTTYAPYSDPPPGLELTDKERRRLKKRLGGSGAGSVWTG